MAASRYVEAASRFKSSEQGVRASECQRAMLAERRHWAVENDLDPDVLEGIYRTLISHFIDREMKHWHEAESQPEPLA